MALTLAIKGRTSSTSPLSSHCLEHIDRLRTTAAARDVEAVFGDVNTEAGTVRTVGRKALLEALARLLRAAGEVAAEFQVRVPPLYGGTLPIVARGVGGVLIGGRYHLIQCSEDHWTLQLTEELQRGTTPTRRYEPAELQSDNMGKVIVEMKNPKESDLATLLRDIQTFLNVDASDEFAVVWG